MDCNFRFFVIRINEENQINITRLYKFNFLILSYIIEGLVYAKLFLLLFCFVYCGATDALVNKTNMNPCLILLMLELHGIITIGIIIIGIIK